MRDEVDILVLMRAEALCEDEDEGGMMDVCF